MARIGMTQLPRKLAEYLNIPPDEASSYRSLFNGAVNGRFPAEFANNRWTVDEVDLLKIAEAMGLTAPPKAAALGKPRKASSALIAA